MIPPLSGNPQVSNRIRRNNSIHISLGGAQRLCFVVECVISRTRMGGQGKLVCQDEPRRRWSLPNGTELLRQRRLVGAVRRLTCVGAKSRLGPGLAPHSLRQSGSARLSIARGFRSTPFR